MKVTPSPQHKAFYDDLLAILTRHQHLQPQEMLAISSIFVGRLIALQDQTKMTPSMALEIVAKNIEEGNRDTVDFFFGRTQGNA